MSVYLNAIGLLSAMSQVCCSPFLYFAINRGKQAARRNIQLAQNAGNPPDVGFWFGLLANTKRVLQTILRAKEV